MEFNANLASPSLLDGIGRAVLGSNWREAARLVKGGMAALAGTGQPRLERHWAVRCFLLGRA